MKYYIVWKTENSCGILKKDGKIPSFRTVEKAMKFALDDAEYYYNKGGFRNQDTKKMRIVTYNPSEYSKVIVSLYDTDDNHCPPDNWITYFIESGK